MYEKLFQDGKLIHIHVGKWSMSCTLDQEDLEIKETLPKIIKLGRKMLIDPEVLSKFNSIEQQARNYLKKNSHRFQIADTRFVPKQNLVEVVKKLKEFKEAYYEAAEDFVTNYEQYKQNILTEFAEYASVLEPYYPRVESLRPRFYFYLNIFEVSFPKKINKLEYEDLVAREDAKQELKDELRDEYDAELEDQYEKAKQNMQEFVTESARASRNQIVGIFENISKKIKNGEVITAGSIKSVRRVIADFNALDFYDDVKVKEKLRMVTELVNNTADIKNDAAMERLNIALEDALKTTQDMSDVDSLTGEYFRKFSGL